MNGMRFPFGVQLPSPSSIAGIVAILWAGSCALMLIHTPAHGCLPIGRYGAPVDVAEETAIIIWDHKTKTEHFIRRARFVTDAKDLGFLVPTPTKPELVEVNQSVFDALWQYTNPPPPAPPGGGTIRSAAAPQALPDAVKVLETKTLAGYDATILAATDAKALTEWLKKNDYPTHSDTESWLEPYIKDKWIITAYKIANSQEKTPRFQTGAVRMSFATERPFYPYREKAGAGKALAERLLRVYFLAQEQHEATLVDGPWAAEVTYARRIDAGFQRRLESLLKLPAQNGPGDDPWFLTEFEDRATARKAGGEVHFAANPDLPTRVRQAASLPLSFPSSASAMEQANFEAFKAVAPAGIAFLGLLAFVGWAVLRPRKIAGPD